MIDVSSGSQLHARISQDRNSIGRICSGRSWAATRQADVSATVELQCPHLRRSQLRVSCNARFCNPHFTSAQWLTRSLGALDNLATSEKVMANAKSEDAHAARQVAVPRGERPLLKLRYGASVAISAASKSACPHSAPSCADYRTAVISKQAKHVAMHNIPSSVLQSTHPQGPQLQRPHFNGFAVSASA